MKKILFGGTLLLLAFILSACGSATNENNLTGDCSKETKTCADGSVVMRTGENCEFAPCPEAAASDMIRVFNPGAGEAITRPLQIIGEARGPWFFEASFVIELLDEKGNLIGQTIATAESDWMTEDYVPFSALMEYPLNVSGGAGTLVFIKNNPSDLPENDAQFRLPILLADSDNSLSEPENLPPVDYLEPGEQINPDQIQPQTREVKLYYYNALLDQDETGNLKCSPTALGSVSRQLSPTETPIEDTINALILGGLGQAELDAGLSTEFPLSGFTLKSANLDNNGVLTLEFSDPENKSNGGSCRVGLLRAQVEATAKQFSEVKEVNFIPEAIFQP